MNYAIQAASCGMMPWFMKIGTGVQALSKFSLRNLRGCNVCIIVGRNLRSTPLR
jgi:hypothetical protein